MREVRARPCPSRRAFLQGSVAAGAVGLAAAGGALRRATAQEPPRGGVLKVAIIGEPPTLDAHGTTASLAYDVMSHIWMYKSALAAKQQLEDVGFAVDLQVLEWATVVQRRNDPKLYDVFTTGIGFQTDPSQLPFLGCEWPGWTCDPKLDALMARFTAETDIVKRRPVWDEIQRWFWDELPVIKLGDFFSLRVKQKGVVGYANPYRPFFWNVGLVAR